MKLQLRPPRDGEWPICRMLLPETFAEVDRREYLLCVRDEAPQVVAAVSFIRAADAATHLRIHVVPGFWQRGVGSQILNYLSQAGLHSLEGLADITKESAATAFCERNGFERVDGLTTVEMDIAGGRDYLNRLRERIALPANARFIRLGDAPFEAVAAMHAQHIVHEDDMNPWRAQLAELPGLSESPVVMIDGHVAGMLAWEFEGSMCVVRSRVAAPEYRGGWLMILLLSTAFNDVWDRGGRRARFSYTDSNRDTQKLARRFDAEVVSVVARYKR
jgi:GNAT superfamily N-acetyltransferase